MDGEAKSNRGRSGREAGGIRSQVIGAPGIANTWCWAAVKVELGLEFMVGKIIYLWTNLRTRRRIICVVQFVSHKLSKFEGEVRTSSDAFPDVHATTLWIPYATLGEQWPGNI